MSARPALMRRFRTHYEPMKRFVQLSADHPASIEGRTLFRNRVVPVGSTKALLVSGHNNRKIGAWVEKGRWAGMPIFTLTLEERATCPRSCEHWHDCMGNSMQWPPRHQAGPELEARLDVELRRLQARHPAGFVVRLHVLGDFYSETYVRRWLGWLVAYPALHVFGYTARAASDPIGRLLRHASAIRWDRFAIRLSNGSVEERGANTIHRRPEAPRVAEGIVCPAQFGPKADLTCCATCALCWGTRQNIVFLAH